MPFSAEDTEAVVSLNYDKLTALMVEGKEYAPCIHRVPGKPRKANEAAYTPRLVSIGPLHRGHGQLQGMESYKLRCLRNFLNRSTVGLDELVTFAADWDCVQGCYQDTINLNGEEYLDMILLDGIFIVELLLMNYFPHLRGECNIIFRNRWLRSDLLHDMLLLENQLPIFVVEDLFNFVDHSFLNGITLHVLACEFFKDVGNTQKLLLTENCNRARHFVEFLLFLHSPARPGEQPPAPTKKFEYPHSATELQQAGVKFCPAEGGCLFDVVFTNGELTLPSLTVNDSTETFFRNLIAFEQCGYHSNDITSYVILMDSLINTPADVDLLVKHKIIKNVLGESKAVAELFNN